MFFTPTAPLRPVSEGRPRSPDDDANQTYIQSLDWRWLNDILNDVPGECWVRPIVDLVKGESMTPLQRLFAVAAVANGMGSRLSVTEWLFLNTDLTVHIQECSPALTTSLRRFPRAAPESASRAACSSTSTER